MAAPGWRRVAMLAAAWVLADLARQYIGTGFPWNPLGSIWAIPGLAGDVMIQPAGWVSVHGLTGATLLLASAPVLGWRAGAASAAALVVWTGLGVWRLSSPDGPPQGFQIILVQGNVAQGQKWDRERAIASFRRYLALTRDAVQRTDGRRVVVWPETASVFWLQQDAAARNLIAEAGAAGAGDPGGHAALSDGRTAGGSRGPPAQQPGPGAAGRQCGPALRQVAPGAVRGIRAQLGAARSAGRAGAVRLRGAGRSRCICPGCRRSGR